MSNIQNSVKVGSTDLMAGAGSDHQSARSGKIAKRCFDVVASLFGLIILSPLMIMVAVAIKVSDPGSAIFGHTRIGLRGRGFKCLKFRSMVSNSREVLQDLLANDPRAAAEWAESQKLRNDPRITRIGKILRETSLDELPQLWNVLMGDMSLVGPRPIVADELTRYGNHASTYQSTRPGITGLWQVTGRSDCSYEERVALDVQYVRNWSFWGDISILFKTVYVVAVRKGSY